MSDAGGGRVAAAPRPPILRVVFFGSVALLIVVELIALGLFCSQLPQQRLSAFAGGLLVAGASILSGALLGFIFGIPRARSADSRTELAESGAEYRANTNLEQVSDWLTKILIGVTLVQLTEISRGFAALVGNVAGIFGPVTKATEVFTGATIVYSLIFGFFGSYIAARTIVVLAFTIGLPGKPAGRSPRPGAGPAESEPGATVP